MNNWLRSLLPGTTPAHIAAEGEYGILRERIFQTLMLGLVALTATLYGVLIVEAVKDRSYSDMVFFTLLLLLATGVAVFRRLPYILRSGSLLLMVFSAGLFSMAQSGLSGHGELFILTFVILTSILLGVRAGLLSLFLGMVTLAVFGFGMIKGFIPIPPLGLNGDSGNSSDWLNSWFFFLLFGGITSIPLAGLVSGFRRGLKRQKELSVRLEEERAALEQNVQERTADLERRLSQIRTAAEISRSISSELDPQALLTRVVQLLVDRIDLYYAGLFLIEDSGRYAVLLAGSGEAGQRMIADGHRLLVGGSSMVGWTTANRKARIALDIGEEPIRFNNPYLPLTRSELALPIIGRNTVLGALTIQSSRPNAFDANDILVFEGITDSLAVALENARMFQQNQRDLEEIRSLNRQYLEQAWAETEQRQKGLAYTYENPLAFQRPEEQGMSLPVILRDQEIGRILLDVDTSKLSEEDRAMAAAITTQTALALENARLLEETQRRAVQEERINTLSVKFSRAVQIEDILKTAVEELGRLPAVTDVSVHLMPGSQGARQESKDGKSGKESSA